MSLIRLIGLALFITAILLALASAITKTTHINLQMPGSGSQPTGNGFESGNEVLPPPEPGFESTQLPGGGLPEVELQAEAVQFTSIPIIWPLLAAAGAGLTMWFMHPPESQGSSRLRSKKRSKRRR